VLDELVARVLVVRVPVVRALVVRMLVMRADCWDRDCTGIWAAPHMYRVGNCSMVPLPGYLC
jgi:hypothetical protein